MNATLTAANYADIGGRRLAYDEVSPARPSGTVLMLPGLGSKRFAWARQLPAFGERYRSIVLDNRDMGDSDPYHEPYATADLADDAAALLRALRVEGAHVVGVSMGGMTALNLAVRHPQLVRSLVLVATTAGGATHVKPTPEARALLRPEFDVEVGERARRWHRVTCAPGFLDARPDVAEEVARAARYKPVGADSYARQFQSTRTHDVTAQLQGLRVPTLVVHGDVDPLIRPENGQLLARSIPGAQLLMYENTGHAPHVERTRRFNQDVLGFIQRVDAAGRAEQEKA